MANNGIVRIFSSDDPLLKNEKSAAVIAKARADLPNADFMIFTSSDFGTGDANLKVLENELIDPGLFGGDRIIKIYLKDLNKSAAQVLLLIAQRIRPGVVIVIDLPRINITYSRLAPKPFAPLPPKSSIKTMCDSAISYIKGIGGTLEIIYPPEGNELIAWINQRASALHLRCSRESAEYIASCLEGNLISIAQTLKLISMTHEGCELTPELLDKTIVQDSRFSGYEIAEAVLNGNSTRALNVLNSFCAGSGSQTESIGMVISQLDNALSVIPKCREKNVGRMEYRARGAFFASCNIRTSPMQNAVLKAAMQMPPQLYNYLSDELATASKLWSTFRNDEALACLQNICTAVGNFAVMSFKSLRD